MIRVHAAAAAAVLVLAPAQAKEDIAHQACLEAIDDVVSEQVKPSMSAAVYQACMDAFKAKSWRTRQKATCAAVSKRYKDGDLQFLVNGVCLVALDYAK